MPETIEPIPFQITRQALGRTLVLSLRGDAELACLDELEAALKQAEAAKPQHVIINLREVTSIAALVNATLSVFANAVRRTGGDVRFVMQPDRRVA